MTRGSMFPPSHRSHAAHARGFTLVELMIVVVIVGVLAMLAVVGFRKLVGEARGTEAIQALNAIRVGQETFHAETGAYDDVSTTLCVDGTCGSLYPQASAAGLPTNPGNAAYKVGDYKVGWGASCTAGCNTGTNWTDLPVHIQGGVMYGYSTKAGLAGAAPSFTVNLPTIGNVTWPTTIPTDWFVITAVGDENMNGVPAVYFGSSFSNDLIVANQGD
jgi:type IV pilus assembly protein PilA